VTDTDRRDGSGIFDTNPFTFLVPRSEALAWGRVEPTADEIAQARVAVGERYAEAVIHWAATRKFMAELDAVTLSPLASAVLDLHRRDATNGFPLCAACEHPTYWPCTTARIVLDDVPLDVPEELVFETPVLPIPDPDNQRWPYPAGPITWADLLPIAAAPRGGIRYETTPLEEPNP